MEILIQIGGPLIAESATSTDDDVGTSDADTISYLIGIVSFGPRVWFVTFKFQIFSPTI